MKININVTDQRRGIDQYGDRTKEEVVVAKFEDTEFTPSLAANFLRALADEIEPSPASIAEPLAPMPEFVPNQFPAPVRPHDQWTITCSTEAGTR